MWRSLFSTSFVASALMIFYLYTASRNLYSYMYPLSHFDLTQFKPQEMVHSLWQRQDGLEMTVYLTHFDRFYSDFIYNQYQDENVTQAQREATHVLWHTDALPDAPGANNYLLTTRSECVDHPDDCLDNKHDEDPSFAQAWNLLQSMEQEDGLLSTLAGGAGQGMESTSILLSLYQSCANAISRLLSGASDSPTGAEETHSFSPTIIYIPEEHAMWQKLISNQTLSVHVTVLRKPAKSATTAPPANAPEALAVVGEAMRKHAFLQGQVSLVKHELPHHNGKPGRYLYKDVVYWMKTILGGDDSLIPPWNATHYKPLESRRYLASELFKEYHQGYPYWKPQVSIKYLLEEHDYPDGYAHLSGMPVVRLPKQDWKLHPTGTAMLPLLYVDEIGLTSDKYIPLNHTLTTLPLRIAVARSDAAASKGKKNTATAGSMSAPRWRLLTKMAESIESQKDLGFEQSDIDDLRRLIADTNVTLLGITMLASALHLLFEFLTFKNEVSFWRNNQDLTGLSVRSLFLDFFGQVIIVLYLIEKDSSLLMTVPSAFGCLIALWKCQRAAGFGFVRANPQEKAKWWNAPFRLVGYELQAMRMQTTKAGSSSSSSTQAALSAVQQKKEELHRLSLESDRIATDTLGVIFLPIVAAYAVYSLVYEEHVGWYSWGITTASSAVYALGFVLMTPQLFLNYKLKSVAHLPWRVLIYKSLNTFIDDLFSFIIRMPTMARLSCFRDDVVFFIYLYQRWLYPVDASRPMEGGGGGGGEADPPNATTVVATAIPIGEGKKRQ